MWKRFIEDRKGQGMTEYILIVALIAVAAIAVVKIFGGNIQTAFKTQADKIKQETTNNR